MDAFHDHLPLESTEGHLPLHWELTKPHFGNFFSETGRGMTGFFSEPVRGYREGGDLSLLYVLSPCAFESQSVSPLPQDLIT